MDCFEDHPEQFCKLRFLILQLISELFISAVYSPALIGKRDFCTPSQDASYVLTWCSAQMTIAREGAVSGFCLERVGFA